MNGKSGTLHLLNRGELIRFYGLTVRIGRATLDFEVFLRLLGMRDYSIVIFIIELFGHVELVLAESQESAL
jgi:hypothetical protein